jgi:hypothetical protein
MSRKVRRSWRSTASLSKRLHQTRSLKRGDATNQLALHYRTSSLSSGQVLAGLHPGDRMPDVRLPDGSRLFEHLRGSHATEFVTAEGPRILIRPDGYIAQIGMNHCSEYAGEPMRCVRGPVSALGGRDHYGRASDRHSYRAYWLHPGNAPLMSNAVTTRVPAGSAGTPKRIARIARI